MLVYRGIVGRFYETAKSLFMHRDGKMKFEKVKRLWIYQHFWRVTLLGFSFFVLVNVQG